MLAIIGGSGLSTLPEVSFTRKQIIRTPYGLPSAPLYFGRMGAQEVVFLSRHGAHYALAPHEINYRANLWALREAGAEGIISVTAVASLCARIAPGSLVIPHDLIDYTYGRQHTFFEGQDQEVVHTDFACPYSEDLRHSIRTLAAATHTQLTQQAVYACIQGPRLPTCAEARRYAQDGAEVLGMTGMPEAILARELGLPYAPVCGVIGQAANLSCTDTTPDFRRQHSHAAMAHIRHLLTGLADGETA